MTGSKAFTENLRKIVGGRASALFKYFRDTANVSEPLDVVILDEAHRIRSVSTSRFTPAKARSGQGADRRHPRRQPGVGVLHRRSPGRSARRGRQHRPHSRVGRETGDRAPGLQAGGAVPIERVRLVHPVGRQHPRARPHSAGPVADGRRLRPPHRRQRPRARAAHSPASRGGLNRTSRRRLLLAVDRPGRRRPPDPRRQGGGLGDALERQGRSAPSRSGHSEVRLLGECRRRASSRSAASTRHRASSSTTSASSSGPTSYTGRWTGDGSASATSRTIAWSRRGVTDEEFTRYVKSTYRVLLTRGLRGCYVCFTDTPTRDFFLSRIERRAMPDARAAEDGGSYGSPFPPEGGR